jgi:hypothetical protein
MNGSLNRVLLRGVCASFKEVKRVENEPDRTRATARYQIEKTTSSQARQELGRGAPTTAPRGLVVTPHFDD